MQRLLKLVAGLLALGAVPWLYLGSTQIDGVVHSRVVTQFERLHQQDARLAQFILQSRFGVLHNYDPLVRTTQEIQHLLDDISTDQPDLFGVGTNVSQTEFQRLRGLFRAKFELVEQFKSRNSVLRNSMAYFPFAVLQEMADTRDGPAIDRFRDLLEHVLLHEQGPAGAGNKAQIESAAKALLHTRPQAENLVAHARIIVNHKAEVDALMRDIAQVPSESLTRELFARYHQDFADRDRSARRYKLGLVALASLMLAYVAWTLNHLQRARRTLSASLRELEFQKFALDQHSIVSVTDRTGKIIYTNNKLSEISQYRRDELLGQDHRLLNSGYHPSSFFKEMWATIGRGQVWQGEVCNRRKDGGLYWVNSTIVPFMDERNRPVRYVSIRTDITARKAMDARIEEQRSFYERVSETLGEGLYVQDPNGRCVYMNSEAERLLGWSRADFLGRPVHDTIHTSADGQPIPQDACAIMRDLLARGEASMEDQYFQRKDGTCFPVSLASRAIRDEQGAITAVVVAFEDISSRKLVEQALRQAKDEAEQANRVKSDFLANMSHEIRTPMNGIIGMTALTLETELTPEQREYLLMVKSSADALLDIVNDILDLSKIEAGKMPLDASEFSLEHLLRETMHSLAVRAHQKHLELLLHVAPDAPSTVVGDAGRLRQVIVNLVGNAIKFTPHGEVEVTVRRLASPVASLACLSFSVRDTGIGIPEDKFRSIFESFSQADSSTTRQYGGTGLGLTISAQLVELMGGQITLHSVVGQGSTFTFVLNLPVTTDHTPPSVQQNSILRGMPVLLVDDNSTSRELLRDMLHSWHMQPVLCDNVVSAESALRHAHEAGSPYPLLICDSDMPDANGFALVAQTKDISPSTVNLVLLASQGQRSQVAASLDSVGGYVVKPVAQSELLDAIMTALGFQAELKDTLGPPEEQSTQSHSLEILLAEDNDVNQALAIRLLEKLGHKVQLARNGAEAIQMWRDGHFQVILMDVDMPVMNGYQATREIRLLETSLGSSRTPIIAMTAHAMRGVREECMRHGMDGYVSKPINTELLLHELQGVTPTTHPADGLVAQHADALPPTQPPALVGKVADLASTRATLDNDRDLFDEIVQLYRRDAPGQLAHTRDACLRGDMDTARRGAHALKGMVGVFDAERSMRAAQALERCTDPQFAPALLAQMESALQELEQAIAAYQWD